MARYPKAHWKPLPENKTEPHIHATQVIAHTMWGSYSGTDSWFRRTDVLVEAHFGISFEGNVVQWIDTSRQADANYKANARAISIETEDGRAIVPWTEQQLAALIDLIDWCCIEHGIPRVQCPRWDLPGLGWHAMWGAPSNWTTARGKTCPGAPRIQQFRSIIIPELVKREHDRRKPKPEPQPEPEVEVMMGYLEENLNKEEKEWLVQFVKTSRKSGDSPSTASHIHNWYRDLRATNTPINGVPYRPN